jgi:hypothetical protein
MHSPGITTAWHAEISRELYTFQIFEAWGKKGKETKKKKRDFGTIYSYTSDAH